MTILFIYTTLNDDLLICESDNIYWQVQTRKKRMVRLKFLDGFYERAKRLKLIIFRIALSLAIGVKEG